MANKLKPHKPTIIGDRPARQTRLGKALRDLILDHPEQEYRLNAAARGLDMAVLSMGVKGEAIKSLVSYANATRVYRDVAESDYVPPR